MIACKSGGGGGGSAPSTSPEGASQVEQPVATPEPTATPEPEVGCTDDKGVFHVAGSTWTDATELDEAVSCSTSTEDKIVLERTRKYACHDGAVVTYGESLDTKLINGSCSPVKVGAVVEPGIPAVGTSITLRIDSANYTQVGYACVAESNGQPVKAGNVANGAVSIGLDASQDLTCYVRATDAMNQQTVVQVAVDVECGNKIKVNGKCEHFECKKFLPIAASANGRIEAPARTSEGICYAMKIADAIANSSSKLTPTLDMEVISRNHDAGFNNGTDLRNPYFMGGGKYDLMIRGPRTVRLAGSADSLGPILVDNFVLRGLYPRGTVNPDASYYRAYGTSDSTVGTTGGVLLKNQKVPVQAFASGGTSTVEPLDLTNEIEVLKSYTLDLRALDCGGSRELSSLYVIFQ